MTNGDSPNDDSPTEEVEEETDQDQVPPRLCLNCAIFRSLFVCLSVISHIFHRCDCVSMLIVFMTLKSQCSHYFTEQHA